MRQTDEPAVLAAGRTATPAPTAPVPNPDALTQQEREVLRLLTEGTSNAAIAESLCISPRTVSHHVARILEKLGVETRTAAATAAIRDRMI